MSTDTNEKPLITDPKELPGYKESAEEVAAVVAASKNAKAVVDDATEEAATDLIAEAKGAVKAADRRRLDAGKPHRDAQDAINGAFKELLGPVGGVVKGQETQVLGHRKRQREEEDERRRAAEEAERKRVDEERKRLADNAKKRQEAEDAKAAEEGRKAKEVKAFEIPDPSPPPAVVVSPAKSRVTASGRRGTMVDNWKFEVQNVDLIPDEFVVREVNGAEVKKAIAEGVREIPGLRIYNDAHLAVSGG